MQNDLVSPSRALYWGDLSPCGPSKLLYNLLLVTVAQCNMASLLCKQPFYIIYFLSSISPAINAPPFIHLHCGMNPEFVFVLLPNP